MADEKSSAILAVAFLRCVCVHAYAPAHTSALRIAVGDFRGGDLSLLDG